MPDVERIEQELWILAVIGTLVVVMIGLSFIVAALFAQHWGPAGVGILILAFATFILHRLNAFVDKKGWLQAARRGKP